MGSGWLTTPDSKLCIFIHMKILNEIRSYHQRRTLKWLLSGDIFFKPMHFGRAVVVIMTCLFTVPTKLPCCPSLAWWNLGLLIHFAVRQWIIYIFCQGEIYVGDWSLQFSLKQNKTKLACLTHDGNIDAFYNFDIRCTDTHNIVLDAMTEILGVQE